MYALHILIINIYYCMSGRAIWENIKLEGGSIGPTEVRDNTDQRAEFFPILLDPRKCNNRFIV